MMTNVHLIILEDVPITRWANQIVLDYYSTHPAPKAGEKIPRVEHGLIPPSPLKLMVWDKKKKNYVPSTTMASVGNVPTNMAPINMCQISKNTHFIPIQPRPTVGSLSGGTVSCPNMYISHSLLQTGEPFAQGFKFAPRGHSGMQQQMPLVQQMHGQLLQQPTQQLLSHMQQSGGSNPVQQMHHVNQLQQGQSVQPM